MKGYFKFNWTAEQQRHFEKIREDFKRAEVQYEKELESLKSYLHKQGLIKPRDFTDFMFWLYVDKLEQDSFFPIPRIEDSYFIEYHQWREKGLNRLNLPLETGVGLAHATFVNNFDNVTPIEIYQHFKTELVDKGYLNEMELKDYLRAAFELKVKPEMQFKLKCTRTKQKIYTIFYTYYKDIAQKKYDRQIEYAALLGDYFEGYNTNTISTNWAKGYKAKR
jgi:hypothetical protein